MKTLLSRKQKPNSLRDLVIYLLGIVFFAMTSCSDSETSNSEDDIYQQIVFGELDRTATGQYADGQYNTFELYQAVGNLAKQRPMVIIAPGGGLYQFTEESRLRQLCKDLAKRGYVTALIRYSIESHPWARDFNSYVRAVRDMKSAVQYFRMNADQLRVDADNIFVGGWSTGAQISTLTAFFEDGETTDIVNEQTRAAIQAAIDNVGFEGVHDGYSSSVKGCVLLFTYILDLNIIDAGEPALMMINHRDALMSYNVRIPVIKQFSYNGITNYGTDLMEDRAIAEGFTSGQNLEYIKSSTSTDKPNEASLSSSNFPSIANFLYNNLD